jgi:Leucine-rich repeat (LRR) protein
MKKRYNYIKTKNFIKKENSYWVEVLHERSQKENSDELNNFQYQYVDFNEEYINYINNDIKNVNNQEGWFELDMSGMGLKILSPEIKYYSHITSLYLNHNKLSSIPNEIFQELKCLTTLDLSYNCLTHIPSGIGSVCTLTKLFLNQNRITEIPLEMGCLFRLKELSL